MSWRRYPCHYFNKVEVQRRKLLCYLEIKNSVPFLVTFLLTLALRPEKKFWSCQGWEKEIFNLVKRSFSFSKQRAWKQILWQSSQKRCCEKNGKSCSKDLVAHKKKQKKWKIKSFPALLSIANVFDVFLWNAVEIFMEVDFVVCEPVDAAQLWRGRQEAGPGSLCNVYQSTNLKNSNKVENLTLSKRC